MKISFNNIPFINKTGEGKRIPSFRAADSGEDKFIKSANSSDSSSSIDIDVLLKASQDLFDSIDEKDPVLKTMIFEKIQTDALLNGLFSSFCDKDTYRLFKNNFKHMSIQQFIKGFFKDSIFADIALKNIEKANVKSCADLIPIIDIYVDPKVNDIYKDATLDFLEICGQLDDKNDLLRYPDLLLHLKDLFSDSSENDLKNIYFTFTGVLKFFEVDSTEHFKDKFKHLAPKFNDFSTPHDIGLALIEVEENCSDKIDLLMPFVTGKNQDEVIDNSCHLYFTMPDIIDTLYEESKGESLGDFKDIFPFASSHENLYKKGLTLVKPVFNDFSTPADKIRFYRTLAKNDVSANDFKKLFSNQIISDMDQMQLFNNKQNIIDFIAQKEKINKSNATSIYYNFADILNVAYSSDNKSDILSETYSLIKNCKFKSSSDVLNFYNQCNISNGRAKSLTKKQFVDFIELIKFVDKQDFKDNKKVKKIRLDNLRETKKSFDSVKGQIEDFLLNRSEHLLLHQTPFSIFMTHKNDLIGATDNQVESLLYEIDKLNIKDNNERRAINFEIDRLQGYFPSRKDVLSFIITNEVSFDNSEDAQEYLLNCNKIFKSLYRPYNQEESRELITKLSNSKFLLNSKNSLNDLLNKKFDPAETYKLFNTFADKKVKSYNAFESFVKEYEVDDKSFNKLLNYIGSMPDNVVFGNVLFQIKNLKLALEKSGFPLKLNADNLTRLSYDDLLKFSMQNSEIEIDILNKLLGLKNNQNPVLALPNVYAKASTFTKTNIAFELLEVQSGSDAYPNLTKFLFGGKPLTNLSHLTIKNYSSSIPNYFVDFVNTKFKAPNGQDYNMSLHAKLRIIERFLMDNVETEKDFLSDETSKKLESLLKSIYNQEQLMFKQSTQGERILFNSTYNGKKIETVFNKSGVLVTAVEKSYK